VTTSGAKLRPSAKLAVLGLVLQRPSWGYELVARFDRAFGEQQPWPWSVTPQAIYGGLNDLEAVELIERIEPEGAPRTASAQRSARQHYRGTAGGARAMREWLASPMLSNPSREELLIRLHFGGADDASLREMLRLHAGECLEELERIGAVVASTRPERLVKEDRRLAVQARLTWIEFALAELRAPGDAPIRPVDDRR
jgi:DNA-binding PadR family transcriptional regulator